MEYKFNTKFKVGDIIYTLIDKQIKEVRIERIEATITIKDDSSQYTAIKYLILNDYTHAYLGYEFEQHLYKTKEELINSL